MGNLADYTRFGQKDQEAVDEAVDQSTSELRAVSSISKAKKQRMWVQTDFEPLDNEKLVAALTRGSNVTPSLMCEDQSFKELLESEGKLDLQLLSSCRSSVTMPSTPFDYGAMKIAYRGQLTLEDSMANLNEEVTDALLNRPVIIKCLYKKGPDGQQSFYPQGHKLEETLREGMTLMWATALLDLAYAWIVKKLKEKKATISQEDWPSWCTGMPWPHDDEETAVPDLYFVKGGFFIGHGELKGTSSKDKTSQIGCYLVEEEIEVTENMPFKKYIHNGCTSIPEDSPFIVKFLAFIQHVQYWLTDGTAFTTDFQGSGMFLTDPQILTDQTIGSEANTVFSGGNVQECFDNFPVEHVCNKDLCKWFGVADGVPRYSRYSEPGSTGSATTQPLLPYILTLHSYIYKNA
ncbi:hypothetical protein D9758_014308 [Tetrapyrgos nigripes]|uniref:Alpha-type protein kinase domain-containing protein n=1 Tax=Tetrapyrgos nigripes TaxID=182062 RepID=A0A8H5CAK2_9AGAR|nr:hypothetical protein D9758_014308 [Tetrapyrgos nigripes]